MDKSSPDTRKTSAASTNLALYESGVISQPPHAPTHVNNSTVYLNAVTLDETSTDDVKVKHNDGNDLGSQPIVPPRPSKETTPSCSSASTSSHSSHHSSPGKKVSTVELGERVEEDINESLSSQLHQLSVNEKNDEEVKQTSSDIASQREQNETEGLPKVDDKEPEESSLSSQHWGPERTVDVVRVPGHGLGISIVGGKIDPIPRKGAKQGTSSAAVTGIFIKNVLEGSPAGATGQLCTGDRILEVDGVDLRKASHEKAVEIIRQSGNVVVFVVQSLLAYDDDEEEEDELEEDVADREVIEPPQLVELVDEDPVTGVNEQGMTTTTLDSIHSIPPVPPPGFENEFSDRVSNYSDSDPSTLPPPPPPPPMMDDMDGNVNWGQDEDKLVINDDSEIEDETDESNFTGQVTLPNGITIDRNSAAFLRKSKKDMEVEDDYGYTAMKVHRKYMKDIQDRGAPKLVSLNKGTNGLGISLAGHKDRSQMAIYVCGLNPLGNAARVGGIGKKTVCLLNNTKYSYVEDI